MIKGMEAWQQAGRIIADIVDKDPSAIDQICASNPHITAGILRSLERIGRSELLPELLLKSGPAYSKLRDLPIAAQRRYMKDPIPVLIQTQNGPDVLNVSIENLTPKQVRQVFAGDCVRNEAAQRAWLADNTIIILPEAETLPFEVHGKTVIFVRPCKMTKADLASLIERIR